MLIYVAVAIAIITSGMAIYFWRRSENIASILMDGAKGYEDLRQKNIRLESAVLTFETQLSDLRKRDEQSRKLLTQASSTNAKTELGYQERIRDLERKLKNTETQRDHIVEVYDALQAKYEELNGKVDEHREAAVALRKGAEEANSQSLAKLKTELLTERSRAQDLDRELKQLKGKETVNPREFDTLKRRASHYERLYAGMKGLRDMVDERNKNWEDALGKMARWILTDSPVAKPNDPVLAKGIGPVVGEALERIGVNILDIDQKAEVEAERKRLSELEYRAGAQSESTDNLPV